ncbi:ATP-binding protein [Streptomyces roseolus]
MLDALGRPRPEFYLTDDLSQSRVLPCAPESAGTARRLAVAVLDRWGLPELADPAQLVVTELVTNAIRHAHTCGASIRVVITRVEANRVQVAVTDLDRRPPVRRQTGSYAEGGRGLDLVAALSERWGYEDRHWGKRVWAELT